MYAKSKMLKAKASRLARVPSYWVTALAIQRGCPGEEMKGLYLLKSLYGEGVKSSLVPKRSLLVTKY
jgi:hypothetical protein